MGMDIKLEWFAPGQKGGVGVFHQVLDKLRAHISDWTPALERMAETFEIQTAEQFSSQGAAGGTPWRPLAESTIARRQREAEKGYGKRTRGMMLKGHRYPAKLALIPKTGVLPLVGGSLEASFHRGAQFHIEEIQPLQLVWGSSYTSKRTGYNLGVMHHFGKGHVPARPILVQTDAMVEKLHRIAVDFIATGARKVGFGVEQLSFGFGGVA